MKKSEIITPVQGEWPTIEKLLRNLFGNPNHENSEKYEWAVDYIKDLYNHPEKQLPALCLVSNEFVPIYYGPQYSKVIQLLMISSPILLIRGISENISKQYLLATDRKKVFTISILGGFVMNIIINILLIPGYGAIGAIIATIVSELAIMICQMAAIKIIKPTDIIKEMLATFLCTLVIVAWCCLIDMMSIGIISKLALKLIFSPLLYLSVLLLIKNKIAIEIKTIITKRRKRMYECK